MTTYSCRDMPTIQAFFDSDAFIRGLRGPLGSGKSSACVIEHAQRGVAVPPGPDGVRRSRWAVVRNTIKQLEDTTEKTFLQWFPPHLYGDWTPSKHNFKIRALRGEGDDRGAEIEIMFRALDREDQISDLLSMELTGAWINEAREVPWAVMENIQGRLGRYPKTNEVGPYWFGLWMDTNPPDVDSPWFKFFEETDHTHAVEELSKVIPGLTLDTYLKQFVQPSGLSTMAENLSNLPPAYYQRLVVGKLPEWVKVYVHGQYGFVADGKAVWPEYVDEMHCPANPEKQPKPSPDLPILRSWDSSGLSPACVFSQLTSRGQWIVFDEVVATGMGADRISDEVLNHCARNYRGFTFEDVGDPAGGARAATDERTYFQILHAKHILIEPAIQTLAIRLESVRKPLTTLVDGRPQFVLHPRCKQLRRALMGAYHYRRMRITGERYTSTPEKNFYANVADALGYGGTRFFGTGLFMPRGGHQDYDVGADTRSRSRVTGY